jgi:hypothetical protein
MLNAFIMRAMNLFVLANAASHFINKSGFYRKKG